MWVTSNKGSQLSDTSICLGIDFSMISVFGRSCFLTLAVFPVDFFGVNVHLSRFHTCPSDLLIPTSWALLVHGFGKYQAEKLNTKRGFFQHIQFPDLVHQEEMKNLTCKTVRAGSVSSRSVKQSHYRRWNYRCRVPWKGRDKGTSPFLYIHAHTARRVGDG